MIPINAIDVNENFFELRNFGLKTIEEDMHELLLSEKQKDLDAEHNSWVQFSLSGLAAAYSDQESEIPVSSVKVRETYYRLSEGALLLAAIPQADGQVKRRPVLLLRELPGFNDLLVCGVSTQVHQVIQGFDELIQQEDPDFENSGLSSDSVIRLGFLAVIPAARITKIIGLVSVERHSRLLERLSRYIVKPADE
jgi:mRNA interferase MazF